MIWYTPLSPELYETLNCGLMVSDIITLVICVRYLMTAYTHFVDPYGTSRMGRWEAFKALRQLRLGVGMTVFLFGETPRMTYLWLVRYLTNTGNDASWMSQGVWVYIPIVSSTIAVFGMACIARALVPLVWGRFSYLAPISITVLAIVATRLIRDVGHLVEFTCGVTALAIAVVVIRRWRSPQFDV